jgi:hypothetical protein
MGRRRVEVVMRKILPMAAVALLAFAAPAFAQEEDEPGMDDPFGNFGDLEELVQKLEETLKPVLDQLQEVIQQLSSQLDEWLEGRDFSERAGGPSSC